MQDYFGIFRPLTTTILSLENLVPFVRIARSSKRSLSSHLYKPQKNCSKIKIKSINTAFSSFIAEGKDVL